MGIFSSKNKTNLIEITCRGQTQSPSQFTSFEHYVNCMTWIHRVFNLPGNANEYGIENHNLFDKFDYPKQVILVNNVDQEKFTCDFVYYS